MIERLEATLTKYNELENELTKPEVLSDIKKTRTYSKEMADLEEIVVCYKRYKKILEDIESTKEMVKDYADKLLIGLTEEETNILTDACKIFTLKDEDVHLVKGEVTNIKITYPYDLKLANTILEDRND